MSDDFRIAVIGQAAFGKDTLAALADGGENIVGVFCPPDREGRDFDPIKREAVERDIPVFQFRRMRRKAAIDAFAALNADLCVMAFVTDIVPDAILEAPTRGTIQYHPSMLPKHRGPSSMNWPIIEGETKTGLTIFWPDKGLDTGPILLQKEVEITPDDTLGSLYFGKLYPMGVEALVEAAGMARDGSAPRIAQDDSQATYEGWCNPEDVAIDWSRPVAEVYNMIRGGDPSPGANSTLDGETVSFFRARKVEGDGGAAGGVPGEVTEVNENGFSVAANGGSIFVGRVQPGGGRKVMAPEWIETVELKPGARFGA